MTPFFILPVKPLAEGKSRLAAVMTDDERVAVNRRLARRTLDVVIDAAGPDRTIVVSRDEAVLELGLQQRAIPIFDPHGTGLIGALDHATVEAIRLGAEAVLVLPTDLPLLARADIDALTSAVMGERAVVIAPDRHGEGTNALLLAPPDVIPYAFGQGSFPAHVASARHAGIEPVVVRRDSLAVDLDTADDHALLESRGAMPGPG